MALGRTVAELEATLSTEEFIEWQLYAECEPFGSVADDNRWRQMYALYFQANRSEGNTDDPDWLDHMPEETARRRRLAEASQTLDDKLEAFFSAIAVEA